MTTATHSMCTRKWNNSSSRCSLGQGITVCPLQIQPETAIFLRAHRHPSADGHNMQQSSLAAPLHSLSARVAGVLNLPPRVARTRFIWCIEPLGDDALEVLLHGEREEGLALLLERLDDLNAGSRRDVRVS